MSNAYEYCLLCASLLSGLKQVSTHYRAIKDDCGSLILEKIQAQTANRNKQR